MKAQRKSRKLNSHCRPAYLEHTCHWIFFFKYEILITEKQKKKKKKKWARTENANNLRNCDPPRAISATMLMSDLAMASGMLSLWQHPRTHDELPPFEPPNTSRIAHKKNNNKQQTKSHNLPPPFKISLKPQSLCFAVSWITTPLPLHKLRWNVVAIASPISVDLWMQSWTQFRGLARNGVELVAGVWSRGEIVGRSSELLSDPHVPSPQLRSCTTFVHFLFIKNSRKQFIIFHVLVLSMEIHGTRKEPVLRYGWVFLRATLY